MVALYVEASMSNSIVSQSDAASGDLPNPYQLRSLTKALIKFSMQDGDRASQELSVRLANMQQCLEQIEAGLASDSGADDIKPSIAQGLSEITSCLIELQFFDRISQRMDHAIQSLDAEFEDEITQKSIEGIFTMQDERILYSVLLEGRSVEEAVELANANLLKVASSSEDDIELF